MSDQAHPLPSKRKKVKTRFKGIELAPQHLAFADAWLISRNGAASYLAAYPAGSSIEVRRASAARLLARDDVTAYINASMIELDKKLSVTREKVVAEMARLAFANFGSYMTAGPDGRPVLDFSALTSEQTAALMEVTTDEIGGADGPVTTRTKFKLHDKRAALADLAKVMGYTKERVELTGKDGGPIEVQDLDPIERANRIAALLDAARARRAG